jgi:D-arginine dehydrogenase
LKNDFYDIIVIGSGFAGASTAYHLARYNKWNILLLERETGFGMHASGRNAALLRQAVPLPRTASFIQETLRVLESPPEDWPEKKVFRRTGSLLLGEEARLLSLHSLLASFSVSSEMYAHGDFPDGLPEGMRNILLQRKNGSVLFTPGDGVIDVHALLGNLLSVAKHSGVRIQYNSPVEKIDYDGDAWVVSCGPRRYRCAVLVNAAGAWAALLAEAAGVAKAEMTPLRRHLYISEPTAEVDASWPFLWDLEHEYYFRPESGGLLLCPGDEDPHPPEEPVTDPKILQVLAGKLEKHCPSLAGLAIKHSWACLRTKREDGDFQVGADARRGDFFWVAALGGHGASASIGVGKTAACQIFDYLNPGKILGKLA